MTLKEKIALVKQDIQTRFPGKRYTVRVLLWDDGTDLVECRYGSKDVLHLSTYYNNELKYSEEQMNSQTGMLVDETGREYFSRETFEDEMIEIAYCKNQLEGKEACEQICEFCQDNLTDLINLNDL